MFPSNTPLTDKLAKRLNVFSVLVLLSMILLVVGAQMNLGRARVGLARILKSIDTLHLIQIHLLTAESQANSYILTKDNVSLRAFQESRQQALELLDILREWLSENPEHNASTEAIKPLMLHELVLLESITQQDRPSSLLVEHQAVHDSLDQQLQSLDRHFDQILIGSGLERAEKIVLWVFSILVILGMSGWLLASTLHRRNVKDIRIIAE